MVHNLNIKHHKKNQELRDCVKSERRPEPKPKLPQQVYLTNMPITVHCTRNQINLCPHTSNLSVFKVLPDGAKKSLLLNGSTECNNAGQLRLQGLVICIDCRWETSAGLPLCSKYQQVPTFVKYTSRGNAAKESGPQ